MRRLMKIVWLRNLAPNGQEIMKKEKQKQKASTSGVASDDDAIAKKAHLPAQKPAPAAGWHGLWKRHYNPLG